MDVMCGVEAGSKRTEPVDYFAMTFKAHKEIEAENKPHMIELVEEIHEKVGVKFAETYVPPTNGAIDYPEEDINPDDVPF